MGLAMSLGAFLGTPVAQHLLCPGAGGDILEGG